MCLDGKASKLSDIALCFHPISNGIVPFTTILLPFFLQKKQVDYMFTSVWKLRAALSKCRKVEMSSWLSCRMFR